jgi:outer membrane immunogenic protein
MKRLLIGIVAVIALASTPTLAADIALKAPCCSTPVWSWTGFYVGGNVGYSWGSDRIDNSVASPPNAPITSTERLNINGAIGGGQAGYNWQTGSWLLGLETDIQDSGQSGYGTLDPCVAANPACDAVTLAKTESEKLTWFGTTRGRIGYANTSWLLYGTGGIAYGGINYNGTTTASGAGAGTVTSSFTQTRIGWAAGGGVEARLTGNWSWKLEYLFLDLQAPSAVTVTVAGFPQTTTFHAMHDDILRAGLNYRFNWGDPCCTR